MLASRHFRSRRIDTAYVAVSSRSVSRCAREVSSTIAASRQHRVPREQPVQRTIFHRHACDADTFAINHHKIGSKVLDEEVTVVLEH